jgi:hypothetical protein
MTIWDASALAFLGRLKPLWAAEDALLANVEKKASVALDGGDLASINPCSCDASATVRADFLQWLFAHLNRMVVPAAGIVLRGVCVKGRLRLAHLTLDFPLVFSRCCLLRGLDVSSARLRTLDLSGSKSGPVDASHSIIDGSLILSGTQLQGSLRLVSADIRGELNLASIWITDPTGHGIAASQLKLAGSMTASDDFHVAGGIGLISAKIAGDLILVDGSVNNVDGFAINGDAAQVSGRIMCRRGFRARGEVRFVVAKCGLIDFSAADLENWAGVTLRLDGAQVEGGIATSEGFHARGVVRLQNARCKGWNAQGATFESVDGTAIHADHLRCDGLLSLTKSSVKGRIVVRSAIVGTDLQAEGLIVSDTENDGILADGIRVNGNALFRNGFNASRLRMYGAEVSGDLDLAESAIADVDLIYTKIRGNFIFRKLSTRPKRVRLQGLQAQELRDDESSWPAEPTLEVDGLTYQSIDGEAPLAAKLRKGWLSRQPTFRPQPYEQLARVYRQMGRPVDAAEIAVEKQRELRRRGHMTRLEGTLSLFLEHAVGYGYKPIRPIVALVLLVVIGTFVFSRARDEEVLCPARAVLVVPASTPPCDRPKAYPELQPFIYSLESLVPIGDFHQKGIWELRSGAPHSTRYRWYLWLHIGFGWMFGILAALSPTKILRRD